jgi:deoxyribose-phosphate aldolase
VSEQILSAPVLDKEEAAGVVDVFDDARRVFPHGPTQRAQKASSIEAAVVAGEDELDLRVAGTVADSVEREHGDLPNVNFYR